MNGTSRRQRSAAMFVAAVCAVSVFGGLCLQETASVRADEPIVRVDAPAVEGRLTGVDDQWGFSFATEGAAVQVSAERLVRWGKFAPPVERASLILLRPSGRLVARVASLDATKLRVESSRLGDFKIKRQRALGWIVRAPADPTELEELVAKIEASDSASRQANGQGVDRLFLANGDQLDGVALKLLVGKLRIRVGAKELDVPVENLAAVKFAPAGEPVGAVAGLHAVVGLSDGSRLPVKKMTLDGKRTSLQWIAGQQSSPPADAIVAVQIFGGAAKYLSDLAPIGYRHVPYLSVSWPYAVDRNLLGGPLACGGRTYIKGIAMHSASRLTYRLDRPYRRFEAELAIDDAAAERGSATFRVFVRGADGKWVSRLASSVVRAGQAQTFASVDISGADQISLLIDYADQADQGDHADWLDARLIP